MKERRLWEWSEDLCRFRCFAAVTILENKVNCFHNSCPIDEFPWFFEGKWQDYCKGSKLYDLKIPCYSMLNFYWTRLPWWLCSFISTPDPVGNKYYLGPAPLEDMARWAIHLMVHFYWLTAWLASFSDYLIIFFNTRQIATANGPNGNNRDYLFSMEKALSNICKKKIFLRYLYLIKAHDILISNIPIHFFI